MFQLEPGVIMWESIAALTTLLVLLKWLRPRIRNALQRRAEDVDRALQLAARARATAEAALQVAQHAAATVESDKQKILLSGQTAAAQITALAEETAQAMTARIRRQMVVEIQEKKDQAIQDLRLTIADTITCATAAVIAQHLDQQKHSELINTAIHDLPVESARRAAETPGPNIVIN